MPTAPFPHATRLRLPPSPLQINLPEYRSFLEYMCPGSTTLPQVPAAGSDPSACPRPVLGTYDDHDSGWNNGNDRLVCVLGGGEGGRGGEEGGGALGTCALGQHGLLGLLRALAFWLLTGQSNAVTRPVSARERCMRLPT